MSQPTVPAPAPQPDPARLASIAAHYEAGRHSDAFAACEGLAPPEHWIELPARILAGRLLSNWGAPVLASRIHQVTHRRHPGSPEALYFAALSSARRHGPYEGLRVIDRHREGAPAQGDGPFRATLLSLEASLLASLRDFTRAHALAAEAARLAPDDPWLRVDLATILEREDRYDEAIATAREALVLRPWYRPALEVLARLLQLRNRDDEARELLIEANTRLQAASLRASLVRLHFESGAFEAADAALQGFVALIPRAERAYTNWMHGMATDVALRLGRLDDARTAAAASDHPFQKHIAARLAAPPPDGRRVQLPVPFVRQHFMTCAPATLSAIARFWGIEIDHEALAREITYDGTPHHVERHWATTHGWVAREFRVTWESTVALIDRGIPFTLTTVYTRSAHLQAVVGYDSTLDLLLIRDPYEKATGEFVAGTFFEGAAPHGPRGMVLVPADRAALLDGIDLPDAALHDHDHALHRALDAHDRPAAQRALDALTAAAPDHRLAIQARRALAGYDGALPLCLEAVDALRERYPQEPNLILARAALLHDLGRTAERLQFLETEARRPGADPQIRREFADDTHEDPRRARRAIGQARSLLSRLPLASGLLRTLANALWVARELDAAELAYRFAATAGRTEEVHWYSWFIATRHTGRAVACIEELRGRVASLGSSTAGPAITLYRALDALDRANEGFEALDAAAARRPDDGHLRLYTARELARHGRRDDAGRLLAGCGTAVRRSEWLRTAAFLAGCRLDHPAALAHWRELLALEPHDREAQVETTRLTGIVHGPAAARDHLRALIEAQPWYVPLRVDLATRSRDEPPEVRLAAIDAILAVDPRHAWAWRERALALREQGRPVDAFLAAERAVEYDPHHTGSLGIKADQLLAMQRRDEAHALYRRALALDASADWLVGPLFESCPPGAARREALEFLKTEVLRQPLSGDTILGLSARAGPYATPEEITAWLRELHEQRPDTWQTWVALREHLANSGQLDEALALAREASVRFPTLPRIWTELADSHARLGAQPERVTALGRAVELNPGWVSAWLQLGLAHEAALDLLAAEHAYRRAMAADPIDHRAHGYLGDLLWKIDRPDEAIAELTRAIELDPDYSWAWRRLHEFHRHRGEPDRMLDVARTAAEARAGEARGWVTLARLRNGADDLTGALEAAARAIEAEPRHTEANDLRAFLLARAGRFDEAAAACSPDIFGGAPPLPLRGRRAWIDARCNRLEDAVSAMARLVEESPDYGWGLECLCEWLGQLGRPADGVKHARAWTRLAPGNADAWGWLAWLLIESGDKKEARTALQRTLFHQPDNLWALHRLFSLHLDADEFEPARRLLEQIRVHAPPANHARATVELACAEGAHDRAIDALAPLLEVSGQFTNELDTAAERVLQTGRHGQLERWLRARLGLPRLNPHVATLWARCWLGRRAFWQLRHADRTGVSEPARRAAWVALLSELGRRSSAIRCAIVLRWRGRWLALHDDTWAEVVYALASLSWPRRLVRWGRDWRTRTTLEPPGCFNLANAHLRLGRVAEACALLDRALDMPPDHVRGSIASFRALLAILGGDAPLCARLLRESAIGKTYTGAEAARTWARALLDVETAAPDARPAAARAAYRAIAACEIDCNEPHIARLRKKAFRRLGERAPHSLARLRGLEPGTHLFCATRTERTLARLAFYGGIAAYWIAQLA